MPMLEKHMTVLSTMVSLGTLAGLLGTVTGWLKRLAHYLLRVPDQAALANGISEAPLTLQQVFLHLHLQS
jgi:biopolymer transport protein ExbB